MGKLKKYITEGFEPQEVLRYFEDICRIPHCSGNEEELGQYIISLAEEKKLEVIKDQKGNILIRKPATLEKDIKAPSILIQGHMDMVCVNKDNNTDLFCQPLSLILDENILRADGTSLGADNGVGLCNMLALMMSDDVVHPPLELLFTVEEETGFGGIKEFDMSQIQSRRMLTMDCGDPDVMIIGSAGNIKSHLIKECEREALRGIPYKISIKGLIGGHSGIEIGKKRASAIELIGRALHYLLEDMPLNLIGMNNLSFGNSIPDAAEVFLAIGRENIEAANKTMERFYRDITAEYDEEKNLVFEYCLVETDEEMMVSAEDTKKIADLLLLSPQGVQERFDYNKEWVMCSSLLIASSCKDGHFTSKFSIRSNQDVYKYKVLRKMRRICKLCGVEIVIDDDIPAWVMKLGSDFQIMCKETYKELFDQELKIEPAHGCVEAGFASHALPGMDIVGIAPYSRGAHTYYEHLYLDSMKPFWEFLITLLEKSCK